MSLTRSTINESIIKAKAVLKHFNYAMPDFALWGTREWEELGPEGSEIRDCMLGWDVTDFGSNEFERLGRTLFTVRNGRSNDPRYPKPYAEKVLIDPEGQRAPAHFHRSKREDIICRHGGNILVQLTKATSEGGRSNESFTVALDGRPSLVEAGQIIRLRPGQSVTIPPGIIHQFWGEEGTGWRLDGVGYTLSNEISSVCDDWNDNVFLDNFGTRFPEITEDAPRVTYLCHEYPRTQKTKSEASQNLRPPNPVQDARAGITLVETLVVVAVLAILIALLSPLVGKMQIRASEAKEIARLRSWGMGLVMWMNEQDGFLPGPTPVTVGATVNAGYFDQFASRPPGQSAYLFPRLYSTLNPSFQQPPSGLYTIEEGLSPGYQRKYSGANWHYKRTHRPGADPFGGTSSGMPQKMNMLSEHQAVGGVSTPLSRIPFLSTYDHKNGAAGDPNYPGTGVYGGKRAYLFFDGHVEMVTVPQSGYPFPPYQN